MAIVRSASAALISCSRAGWLQMKQLLPDTIQRPSIRRNKIALSRVQLHQALHPAQRRQHLLSYSSRGQIFEISAAFSTRTGHEQRARSHKRARNGDGVGWYAFMRSAGLAAGAARHYEQAFKRKAVGYPCFEVLSYGVLRNHFGLKKRHARAVAKLAQSDLRRFAKLQRRAAQSEFRPQRSRRAAPRQSRRCQQQTHNSQRQPERSRHNDGRQRGFGLPFQEFLKAQQRAAEWERERMKIKHEQRAQRREARKAARRESRARSHSSDWWADESNYFSGGGGNNNFSGGAQSSYGNNYWQNFNASRSSNANGNMSSSRLRCSSGITAENLKLLGLADGAGE
eukprot:SAG31_NODE_7438_length_1689_cov_1.199371_2_plen_341_part_00